MKTSVEPLQKQASEFLCGKLTEANPKMIEAYSYLINQFGTISNYLYSSELTIDNNFQEMQCGKEILPFRNF